MNYAFSDIVITPEDITVAKEAIEVLKFLIETGSHHDIRVKSRATVEELVSDPSFCPSLDFDSSLASTAEVPIDTKVKYVNWFKSGGMREVKKQSRKKESYRQSLIEKWQRDLEGGSSRDKYRSIKDFMALQFQEARQACRSVLTTHLRSWAIMRARQLDLPLFKASETFLYNFKEYGISSRKVTKYVTSKQLASAPLDFDNKGSFVLDVQQTISENNIPLSNVINLDQSPYNYAMQQNRTLSKTGEKITKAFVESLNKMTHSYSIQEAIAADGSIPGPLHICLQESTGMSFGSLISPKVASLQSSMQGVLVSCSSSGKFHTSHHKQYLESILPQFPEDEKVLLLIDSWSGQAGSAAQAIHASFSNLIVKVIPAGTTDELQPEDVYFFRQRKAIWRKLIAHVRVFYPEIDITDRESIIIIQAQIRDQLLAPSFKDMIQYAFSKPGYMTTPTAHFQSINDVCFSPLQTSLGNCCKSSQQSPCKSTFIICSHCGAHLCFTHFFNVHFHVVRDLSNI